MKSLILNRFKNIMTKLTAKRGLDRYDFILLKTTLMLAAVDGEVSNEEVRLFRELAAKCHGFRDEEFADIWNSALRSAGYLLLQSHFLGRDELVAEFVNEATDDFVSEVILESSSERGRAFEQLVQMATADENYSDVEKACIAALTEVVRTNRRKTLAERYPHAPHFDIPLSEPAESAVRSQADTPEELDRPTAE